MKNGLVVGLDGSKEWYMNGAPHREDGPAVELANGTNAWWLMANPAELMAWLSKQQMG